MVDRTDIDALLIGALYGELTPADEARLTAHLESHPADRTALDDLTRTRAAVRDSRILAFQAEPPQSISALLLQEASRRAPRRVEHSETASWFQRFVQSFMAHPAMAAAATLVLVIAAAGTFYLRGTQQFADTASSSEPERVRIAAPTPMPAATAPAAEAPVPEAAGAGAANGDSIGAPTGSSSEAAAGSGGAPSRLDDSPVAKGKAERGAGAIEPGEMAVERAKPMGKADGFDGELRKLRATTAEPKADKPEPVRGIELRTRQLAPKDLKESEQGRNEEMPSAGQRANADYARDSRNAVVSGGGAAAAAPATPPPPPVAQAPAPAHAAGPAGNDLARDLPQAQAAPANDARRAPAKPALNQLPASSANNATSGQAERRFDKTANAANNANASADPGRQAQLLDWARKQRDQVITLVNANRCREAASAAVEIYNRAPEYFNASVATDRQIRPCLAYVNEQRDRAERLRANKNAADVQAPAQAAPTRK